MIEVTGVDLAEFARKVFELSKSPDDSPRKLSETMLGVVLENKGERQFKKYVLDMHKVQGRDCNMTVYESSDGRWFINDVWYGHSDEQFDQLLNYFGIERKKQ